MMITLIRCPHTQSLKLYCLQVEAKQLEKNSFWVSAKEEQFESEDILSELLENFSTKAGMIL